jgi:hypothetical protein
MITFNNIIQQIQSFTNTILWHLAIAVITWDYQSDVLLYDIYDKINTIQKPTISHICLPENEDDMINNYRQPYIKLYPNLSQIHRVYPDINKVMTLFKTNRVKIKSEINAFLPAFAGYWIHTFIHTWYNPNKMPYQNVNGLCGEPIYGITLEMENILRTGINGEIRMRNDQTPLRIKDLSSEEAKVFNMINPNNDPNLFICGINRANASVGTYVFHTLAQRNHNRLCKQIYNIDNTLQDNAIFQIAKTINLYQIIKIVAGPYIGNINGLYPIEIPLNVNPTLLLHKTNAVVPIEYNLVYQFHLLLPEKIASYSLQEIAFNTDIMYKKTIPEWIDILQNTSCFTQNIQNCQPYFLPAEQAAIQVGRNTNMLSYCQYREKLGLTIPKTFYDVTHDDVSAKLLYDVYGNIENLEFYVGINSEPLFKIIGIDAFGQSMFGETTSKILALGVSIALPKFIYQLREYLAKFNNPRIFELVNEFNCDDFINNNIHETLNPNFKFKFKC